MPLVNRKVQRGLDSEWSARGDPNKDPRKGGGTLCRVNRGSTSLTPRISLPSLGENLTLYKGTLERERSLPRGAYSLFPPPQSLWWVLYKLGGGGNAPQDGIGFCRLASSFRETRIASGVTASSSFLARKPSPYLPHTGGYAVSPKRDTAAKLLGIGLVRFQLAKCVSACVLVHKDL